MATAAQALAGGLAQMLGGIWPRKALSEAPKHGQIGRNFAQAGYL